MHHRIKYKHHAWHLTSVSNFQLKELAYNVLLIIIFHEALQVEVKIQQKQQLRDNNYRSLELFYKCESKKEVHII